MHKSKDYLGRKNNIIKHFKKNGVSRDIISEYCMFSFIPITVVCEFIAEELPEYRDLCQEIVDSINEFYGNKK